MGENLTSRTVAGLRWTYAATVLGVVLQLVYTAIMGRLLRPADFGLVAMAAVVVRFGTYFAQMGVGPALVQKLEITQRDVRVAFTSSVLLGIVATLVLVALAPLAAAFYGSPSVTPVLRVLALSFVVNGIGLTAVSLLRRQLRFRALGMATLGANVIAYLGIGVVAAALGAGVWSLVAATVALPAMRTIFALAATRHAVVPLLARREMGRLFGFGGRVSVISIMEYLGINLDTFAIGRYTNQELLGQYNRAVQIISLPLWNLTVSMSQVLFPAMSRIQQDVPRVRRAYLEAISISAALILPLTAGLAVAAHELVLTVLGSQWVTAAAILPIICATSAVALLSHFGGIVCEALGALNRKIVLQASHLVVLIAALSFAVGGELQSYALAVLGAELFRHACYIFLMRRVLGIPIRQQLGRYLRPLVTAGIVAVTIGLVTVLLRQQNLVVVVAFMLQALTGALTLLLAFAFGPLRPVRHQLLDRLIVSGVLADGGGVPARVVGFLLRFGGAPVRGRSSAGSEQGTGEAGRPPEAQE